MKKKKYIYVYKRRRRVAYSSAAGFHRIGTTLVDHCRGYRFFIPARRFFFLNFFNEKSHEISPVGPVSAELPMLNIL